VAQPHEPLRHKPALEVERILLVDLVATQAQAKGVAPSTNREMGQTEAAEATAINVLPPLSDPILQAKPSTHRMCAQDHLFHTQRQKVFTDSQMSRIKYIYCINNVSKD
jgi:hypothetical protein